MSHPRPEARPSRDVVVGVDGSAASQLAVRYALDEAARLHGSVVVVHAIPDHVPRTGRHLHPHVGVVAAGRAVLRSVLDRIEPSDEVPVRSLLLTGATVASLASVARRARVVVVGADRRPAALRILTGNVSTALAATAPTPVVSVPSTWDAGRRTGLLLVGLRSVHDVDGLLQEAFAVARERSARLLVVHALRVPPPLDEGVPDEQALQAWEDRTHRELEAVLEARGRDEGVAVELRVVRDAAARALTATSAEADEVLVLRRGHGFPAAAHLGSTARSVLLHARCPVRIVPPGYAPLRLDLELEDAGAALK